MDAKISVIVPVYNVAAYLSECLESILGQDFKELEVILIDDGSTDNSGAICDEYAAKDPRVVVIHQKNSGAAAAKNAGLRVATGKYLSFVDSDDYLEPGAYTYMVSQLEHTKADAVQCTFRDVFLDKTVPYSFPEEESEFTNIQYLEQFTKDWTCGLLWDKLYVRDLFDGVFFEEGHKIDDEYFTYRGIMNAQKIVRDNFVIYNYRKRRSSVMYSPESGRQILKDRIDYLSKRRVNVIARFPELREVFDRHFVEMLMILSWDPAATEGSQTVIRGQLIRYLKEKKHTAVDIRLWFSVLRILLGWNRSTTTLPSAGDTDTNQYFD